MLRWCPLCLKACRSGHDSLTRLLKLVAPKTLGGCCQRGRSSKLRVAEQQKRLPCTTSYIVSRSFFAARELISV